MPCIARRPRCGTAETPVIPEPLTEIGSIIAIISTIIGVLIGVGKAVGAITVTGGIISVGGIAIGGAALGGAFSGIAGALAMLGLVSFYVINRCTSDKGLRECVAGVVHEIVQDFNDAVQEIFPFTAMHDRVDVVVKSRFWDVVEDGQAFVHCTDEVPPRRSEIMRCYFFTDRVCSAATGAEIGAGIGAVAGMIAAVAIAAAIGCATIILCLIALIVAALVAAIIVLVGAFAGGQIGKAVSDATSPSSSGGTTIAVGDLITVNGNMVRREFDEAANVMWWVTSSSLSGSAPAGTPNSPFSYCELDEIFPMDGCPLPPPG